MDQVSIKYTNIFHCKTLRNLPKFGFLVWKQTIWQPCVGWVAQPETGHRFESPFLSVALQTRFARPIRQGYYWSWSRRQKMVSAATSPDRIGKCRTQNGFYAQTAWSSGIVSASHQEDCSYGSRDRIPPRYKTLAFFKKEWVQQHSTQYIVCD
jgi:hypothetical protein